MLVLSLLRIPQFVYEDCGYILYGLCMKKYDSIKLSFERKQFYHNCSASSYDCNWNIRSNILFKPRGGSRISGKGFLCIKVCVGGGRVSLC